MENGEEKTQEEKDLESSKKAAKVGAKAAATYYAGPVGGEVVEALAKTKLGDKALTQAANKANKNPFTKKALRKADEKGITDKADKAVDQYAKAKGGGKAGTGGKSSTASKSSGLGGGNNASSNLPSTGKQKGNPKPTDTSASAKTDNALSKSNSKSSDDDTVKKIGKSIWKILPLRVKIFIISAALLLISLLLFLVLLTLLMSKFAEDAGYDSMQLLGTSSGITDSDGVPYVSGEGGMYEDTIVNVKDTQGNIIAHPASLEDYVIGVTYAELGIVANGDKWGSCKSTTSSEQCDEFIKAQMIAVKTYGLARGRYNINSKSISIRSSSQDQNWCDINNGCDRGEPTKEDFFTVKPHTGEVCTIGGKSQTSLPNECWKKALSTDSLAKYRELYKKINSYILIREGLTVPPNDFSGADETGYTSTTQKLMEDYAREGYTFEQILKEIYDGDPRSKFTLIRTLSNSRQATNKYGTIEVPGTFETILIDNNGHQYNAKIGSCPGYRNFKSSPFHTGIDLSCKNGECDKDSPDNPLITAVAGGKVSLINQGSSGCGTGVSITTSIDGYEWKYTYCHMQEGSRLVSGGTTVSVGQKLGRMGSTGNSTGPHLHFGVKRNGILVDICSIFLNIYQVDKCTNEDVRYDCDNSQMTTQQQKNCHAMFSPS